MLKGSEGDLVVGGGQVVATVLSVNYVMVPLRGLVEAVPERLC